MTRNKNYYENGSYEVTSTSMCDYTQRRKQDEKDEKIVGAFLDNYFYSTLSSTGEVTINRNGAKETQIKGLDVTVTDNVGFEYKIDEKAATRWIGKTLNTFAQEISAVNVNGEVYNGWFTDFSIMNDYWVYVWIDSVSTTDNKLYTYEDITDATIAMVNKRDVYRYMRKNNITSERLKEIGEWLRSNNYKSTRYNGFKICMQVKNQEKAANILIPKDTLINELSGIAVRIKGVGANKQVETLRK